MISAVALLAATLGGLPASLSDRLALSAPGSVQAGSAPPGSEGGATAGVASASYELAAPVGAAVLARLTFAGEQGSFDVTVEGVPVEVPLVEGTTTVETAVVSQDGWVTVALSGPSPVPSLVSFEVSPVTSLATGPGEANAEATQPGGTTPSSVPVPSTAAPSAATPSAAAPSVTRLPSPTAPPARPPLPVPVPGVGSPGDTAWKRVFRHDFQDMQGVLAFQSRPEVNSGLSPQDSQNSPLQRPTLRANVGIVLDAAASDGRALGVHTRIGDYKTSSGQARGWSNGRMMVEGQEQAPPVRIRTRLKMTRSAYTKSAVMWWPADGGWPWEVDFAETFGGPSTADGWGARQRIAQRWHSDINGDGRAKEELKKDIELDATQYHVYDLFITPQRMWIEIDGVKRMETTDRRYIPTGRGYFGVGKAMTHRRDVDGRTDDAVLVDWVEIYRGGTAR